MTIFFMIFGDKTVYHVQAYLSIRSFQKQMKEHDRIVVITTHPEFYASSGTDVIKVTNENIKEWQGERNFFWRAKIKAIEYMSNQYPDDHLIYLDTDTFLYGSLDAIRALLDQGHGMMHLKEGHPSTMMTRSLRMWKQIAGKQYGGITMGMEHEMYNAGVVALPKEKAKSIASLALALCDGMLEDDVERIVIEQYSLSIALFEQTQLLECDNYIGHYWGNKPEWESLAYNLIANAHMKKMSLAEELEQLDFTRKDLPPIYIHHSSTGRRLKDTIDKLFKDKKQKYILSDNE